MALIELFDLSQRRGSATTLKGVSLAIEKGEILAIIGPTGSGKTTLLRIVDQLDRPASGRVLFDGQEVTPRLSTFVRRRISMVLQKPVVLDASVYENVAYPLKLRKYDRKAIPSTVDMILQTVGLDGYQKRKARTLSGGETQKVALARALVTHPQVLLLDEPTANLDPVSLETIENLILRLNRDSGMAIVIATHEMAQGQRLAHRVGVMMQGELIQVGRPEEIFYSPSDLRVAQFVGVENIMKGRIASNEDGLARIEINGHAVDATTQHRAGEDIYVCIRPEEITLSLQAPQSSARNAFSGEVTLVALSGPVARVEVDCGIKLVSLVTRRSAEDLALRAGQRVHASFKATAVHIITHAGSGPDETAAPGGPAPAGKTGPNGFQPPDPRWFTPGS